MANSLQLQLPPAPDASILKRWVRGAIGLTVAALALLLAVVLAISWQSSEQSLAQAVDTDMAGLVDIYATSGEAELNRRIADRTALASFDGRQAHYLLGEAGGARLAGDLHEWPRLSPGQSEGGFVTLSDGTRLYARATRLGPGRDLVVAREYEADRQAIGRLAAIFLAAALAIVLAVWLIGQRATGAMRQRLARITFALRAAERGEEAPPGENGPRDEIGELADYSARAIARAASLARTHRHMSDHLAHEIRTPLTHLDNRLVACLRGAPEMADQVDDCRAEIRSCVAMLDSLLDIAASEARVGDCTGLEEVDLSVLAEDLVELYAASAEEAGLSLRSYIEAGVTLPGERMQLTRLISNLLDNALKYVPRGGTVRLRVAAGPVIEVSDDGPGVEPHLAPFVFDRFRSGSPRAGRTSHGLGLALARAISLRHGLRIGLVDSAQGAHFAIRPHALWPQEGQAE
jgi:signal transduction histidine kinase